MSNGPGSLRKCGCRTHEVWATLEGSHCHLREAHSMPVSMYTVSIPIFIQHAQLKDRIAKTIDYLKSVKQSEIDGTEDKDISITFPSGQTRQFTGQSLLLGNSLPNFWFHTTTAYDIVRQCGIEVGKRDFMGTPPSS